MADEEKTFHRFQTDVNVNPQQAILAKLSPVVVEFLQGLGESPEHILKLPIVQQPPVDDSLPLTHYFVSTSHNTYLLTNQLWGKASAAAYTAVLNDCARCVEIDVWPSDNGPKVTHGYTLTQNISFRDACMAIGKGVHDGDWPVFVSLECHVGLDGQQELIDIMSEAWGERLVTGPVADGKDVTPANLKGRIVLMVEYYTPEPDASSSSSSDSEDEKTKKEKARISDSLAALGVYAHSIKPHQDWFKQVRTDPINILINISESALLKLVRAPPPLNAPALALLNAHAQKHLRRVYPRGTRVASGNLDPLPAWRAGSHFVSMNWQAYDRGVQLNEALFGGGPGWVVKPRGQRGLEAVEGKTKLLLDVVGLSGLPHPDDDSDFKVRIRVQLFHAAGDREWSTKSIRCKNVRKDEGADAFFNERLEWEFDVDELAFIRISAMEDQFGPDDKLAVFVARVQNIQEGWRLVHLLDTDGKDTHATVLVRFTIVSAE